MIYFSPSVEKTLLQIILFIRWLPDEAKKKMPMIRGGSNCWTHPSETSQRQYQNWWWFMCASCTWDWNRIVNVWEAWIRTLSKSLQMLPMGENRDDLYLSVTAMGRPPQWNLLIYQYLYISVLIARRNTTPSFTIKVKYFNLGIYNFWRNKCQSVSNLH